MADFSDKQIQDVWNKGTTVENYDSVKYRKDVCGAWMQRDKYGKEETLGWEIDHVYPESKGGDETLINLRPMHWENNRSKADDFPSYTAVKTSNDTKNVDKEERKTVNDALLAELKKLYRLK
ncbi:MAG: HNH endonuclease [Flammeovirgaceae bacterium]|nr:MAG: HNH endonuclease [Flammeovirgaceae bacterium]